MSHFGRSLRRTLLCLLCLTTAVASAQTTPFINQPKVWTSGGRVTSFLTKIFQTGSSYMDMLYVNAAATSGSNSSVTAGVWLNGPKVYTVLDENEIAFTGASNVVAAMDDFDGDGTTDFAFAISGVSSNNLCVYYGNGSVFSGLYTTSIFNGGNAYPIPTAIGGGDSGCLTLPTTGAKTPVYSTIASLPFSTTSAHPGLLIEDSANGVVYIYSNNGVAGSLGALNGFTLTTTINLAPTDGPGPIYLGDFNRDGYTDFIVNGQTSHSATVYLGNGDGTFQSPARATLSNDVLSMLMQEDSDGIANMVIEGDNGVIEIHKGNGDGTFQTNSEGGTATAPSALDGNGGHLAAIDPNNLDILTTTPIGLSVLKPQSTGSLNYSLANIYNIGSGRSDFLLEQINTADSYLDLAVDSAEGIAVVSGNADGSFNTTASYPVGAPALSATVGSFTASGCQDVAVATDTTKAQLLTSNCYGVYTASAAPTNSLSSPAPALWSNLLSGDFNGNGKLDLAYSLTGLPAPASGTSGLYVQYGNGNGTFQAPVAVSGASGGNSLFGESVVGDFNGDGIADIANSDAGYDDTLIGKSTNPFSVGLNQSASKTAFNQVAAGYFTTGRSGTQDLIFQQGSSLIPYKNDGKGNFTAMPALSGTPTASTLAASTVLLADVDKDGYGDVIALYHYLGSDPSNPNYGAPNQIYIWYGYGDGTFAAPVISPLPSSKVITTTPIPALKRNYYMAAVGDMNNDGLPDLVLSDGYVISVLYNLGGGIPANRSFGNEQHFLAGQGINSISLADVNGDGKIDLIAANGGETISNPIALLGSPAQSSLSLAANPAVNTGGVTVLLNSILTMPVTEKITVSPEPSKLGATFTLNATLTPSSGVAEPTGSVTFSIDGVAVSNCSPSYISTGIPYSTANCVIPAANTYTAGTRIITVSYDGDLYNSPITASASHVIQDSSTTTVLYLCVGPRVDCPTGTVQPPLVSTLTMTYGQYWNGTSVVTAADGGTISGYTTIYDSYNGGPAKMLCSVLPGQSCPAAVGTTLGTNAGTNVITAAYQGDTNGHTGSTSNPVAITVLQDTNTATLTSSLNPATLGQSVTFTAILTGNYAPPTGTVDFTSGSTTLCAAVALIPSTTNNTSTATCTTTSALPVGSDAVTVSYAATLNFAAATKTITETINAPLAGSFTLTVTPNPVNLGVGYGTGLTVTVTALNGFSHDVDLACGTLPTEASCTFTPATVPGGSGSSTLFLETTSPHSCGNSQSYFVGSNGGGSGLTPLALPALAGLVAIFIPGRRRWLRALLIVALAVGATQLTGCSNCTDLATRPGTYTFQITGTASTGEVETQTITLNVTI
ncbi:MAG: FG-GAP-like repeat-containing protein [Acidobacteriaceae bacterium]|nr:FG-GAP-like repeat-containing protein [Acidobacteriaceae bacterium]